MTDASGRRLCALVRHVVPCSRVMREKAAHKEWRLSTQHPVSSVAIVRGVVGSRSSSATSFESRAFLVLPGLLPPPLLEDVMLEMGQHMEARASFNPGICHRPRLLALATARRCWYLIDLFV
jgi:hypothetical protein